MQSPSRNTQLKDLFSVLEGLYNQYLQNVISTTANAKARASLEERYAKLVDAKVFLCCALFIDVLVEAKNFSLKTQKCDISIIDVVAAFQNTKQNYQQLLKYMEKDPALVLKLPTLKLKLMMLEQMKMVNPVTRM